MIRRRLALSLALVALTTVAAFAPAGPAEAQLVGKYRGVVVNVTDPAGLGRIQALVPSALGAVVSGWALPALPYGGVGHGLVLLPEVGDNVWIEFEGGDAAFPIWTGTWFTSSAPPPVANPATTRALVTSQGHRVVVDEVADQIEVLHAGGGAIRLTGDTISLSIGGTSLVLNADGIFMNGKRVVKTK